MDKEGLKDMAFAKKISGPTFFLTITCLLLTSAPSGCAEQDTANSSAKTVPHTLPITYIDNSTA